MSWLNDKTDEQLGKLTRQVLDMYKEIDDEQQRMGTTTATMALIASAIDINSTNFRFKVENLHDNTKQYGTWTVYITKHRSLWQKITDFITPKKKGLITSFTAEQDLQTKEIKTKEKWT